MVALHWQTTAGIAERGADQFWLLKADGGRYGPQSLSRWTGLTYPASRLSLTEEVDAIVIYYRMPGTPGPIKKMVLRWRNGTWRVE